MGSGLAAAARLIKESLAFLQCLWKRTAKITMKPAGFGKLDF